ncbi:MAG: fumarate hydratase [Anaerolineales bacterium]|jgi:fumarate hydratase class I
MRDLTENLIDLIRRTATDLPQDVRRRLAEARDNEQPDSAARSALETILRNADQAQQESSPICQDTGTPLFFVRHPIGWSTSDLRDQIRQAVALATERAFLRPNAVDSLSGKNSGDNLGDPYFPTIHFEETRDDILFVDLMLKGGGCENVGAQYSLPDDQLNAGRDLPGVRKAVLHAVWKAQGLACAPGILGVSVGGDRGSGYLTSKEQLLRPLGDQNPDPSLRPLEDQLTREANQLGIGPMGFGGKTTVLGVKITSQHRLPASFFVTVSYMCWADRRRRLTIRGIQAEIE